MKTGIEIIAAERARQVEEKGWSPEHDDHHKFGELGDAALVYAECAVCQVRGATGEEIREVFDEGMPYAAMDWPWTNDFTGQCNGLKVDDDPIRNLAKAGALIAAEIDRLERRK